MAVSALDATLRMVAAALAGARDPWWVIGSAAVRLHGAVTPVADVDVLAAAGDAARLCRRWGREPAPNAGDAQFRSTVFERFDHLPLTVEVMGGLSLRDAGGWAALRLDPARRVAVAVGAERVFVPDRAELVALLHRFGRAKDRERAALLTGGPP